VTSRPERDLLGPPNDSGVEGDGVPNDDGAETAEDEAGPMANPVSAAAEEILTDVAGLTAQRDEYLAALQRSQADFANYRKRVLRQQEEKVARAALDLVGKLLPVLDALDLAVAHLDREAAETETTEAQALRQARALLLDTLAKDGLERVDEVGVPFDPAVHDAVAHAPAPDDEEPGAKVDEIMRAGYRWRSQTVRPAMVRARG